METIKNMCERAANAMESIPESKRNSLRLLGVIVIVGAFALYYLLK